MLIQLTNITRDRTRVLMCLHSSPLASLACRRHPTLTAVIDSLRNLWRWAKLAMHPKLAIRSDSPREQSQIRVGNRNAHVMRRCESIGLFYLYAFNFVIFFLCFLSIFFCIPDLFAQGNPEFFGAACRHNARTPQETLFCKAAGFKRRPWLLPRRARDRENLALVSI